MQLNFILRLNMKKKVYIQIKSNCTGYYDRHGEKKFRLVKAGEILEVKRNLDNDCYLCKRTHVNYMKQTVEDKIEIPRKNAFKYYSN